MDLSLFYAADGERAPAARRRNAKAKAVCAQCTVIDPCRRWALATRERWGVWGGLTPDERMALVDHRSA
jgi:WhiB family redox-sensing transcriptional regulator